MLLAGESWVSTATHIKGFDQFPTVTFHTGADAFVEMLRAGGIEVTWMKAHEAPTAFPATADGLAKFDVITLSDIGANSLLLHPDTWIHSRRTENRLKLLRNYVRNGGGLLMVGGYYSFQGINGGARYHNTPVEDVLPVTIHPFDDRVETPEGYQPKKEAAHPVTAGIDFTRSPILLGLNEVVARPGADVLLSAEVDEGRRHPLLVTGAAGKGRAAAWTTDIGPHWMPGEFLSWDGTKTLFHRLVNWLAGA